MNNIRSVLYAIIQIMDSLIIMITLGFVHTTMPFHFLVWWEKTFGVKKPQEKEWEVE